MMMTPVDSWISGRYSLCWYIVGMGITSVAPSTDCKLAFLNESLLTIVIHLQSFVFALQTSLLSASSVYSCPFCNLCFFSFESLCKLCFELCKAFLLDSCKSLYFEALQSVCVCVRERERECVCERQRERECVCVCVWIVNSWWRDRHRHGVYSHDRFAASNRLPLSSRYKKRSEKTREHYARSLFVSSSIHCPASSSLVVFLSSLF
jgi:hypothetical protein